VAFHSFFWTTPDLLGHHALGKISRGAVGVGGHDIGRVSGTGRVNPLMKACRVGWLPLLTSALVSMSPPSNRKLFEIDQPFESFQVET